MVKRSLFTSKFETGFQSSFLAMRNWERNRPERSSDLNQDVLRELEKCYLY